jgi:hypothetical protein
LPLGQHRGAQPPTEGCRSNQHTNAASRWPTSVSAAIAPAELRVSVALARCSCRSPAVHPMRAPAIDATAGAGGCPWDFTSACVTPPPSLTEVECLVIAEVPLLPQPRWYRHVGNQVSGSERQQEGASPPPVLILPTAATTPKPRSKQHHEHSGHRHSSERQDRHQGRPGHQQPADGES